tara:strand:+ start:249 stop:443 length:195 start_codon:yes stop_codon:yes gene_type:complete
MSEREGAALWLKYFNGQWKKDRAESEKNDFWSRLPKWGGGACNYGNYANQDRDIRLERSLVINE